MLKFLQEHVMIWAAALLVGWGLLGCATLAEAWLRHIGGKSAGVEHPCGSTGDCGCEGRPSCADAGPSLGFASTDKSDDVFLSVGPTSTFPLATVRRDGSVEIAEGKTCEDALRAVAGFDVQTRNTRPVWRERRPGLHKLTFE